MLEHPERGMVGAWDIVWDDPHDPNFYRGHSYETQRKKPSRHWMKKKAKMVEAGTWESRWERSCSGCEKSLRALGCLIVDYEWCHSCCEIHCTCSEDNDSRKIDQDPVSIEPVLLVKGRGPICGWSD